MVLHTTMTHLELYNKIAITRKQRKTSQNFQNAMHFPLLHYTSKNEKKGHECCQKKKKKKKKKKKQKKKKKKKKRFEKKKKKKKQKNHSKFPIKRE